MTIVPFSPLLIGILVLDIRDDVATCEGFEIIIIEEFRKHIIFTLFRTQPGSSDGLFRFYIHILYFITMIGRISFFLLI